MAEVAGPGIAPNLERRSRLRRLDDLLEALEALNVRDAPALSASVGSRSDQLGIDSSGSGALFAGLIDGVVKAREHHMFHTSVDRRKRPRRLPLEFKTLSLNLH
jgi:hypothetical protein